MLYVLGENDEDSFGLMRTSYCDRQICECYAVLLTGRTSAFPSNGDYLSSNFARPVALTPVSGALWHAMTRANEFLHFFHVGIGCETQFEFAVESSQCLGELVGIPSHIVVCHRGRWHGGSHGRRSRGGCKNGGARLVASALWSSGLFRENLKGAHAFCHAFCPARNALSLPRIRCFSGAAFRCNENIGQNCWTFCNGLTASLPPRRSQSLNLSLGDGLWGSLCVQNNAGTSSIGSPCIRTVAFAGTAFRCNPRIGWVCRDGRCPPGALGIVSVGNACGFGWGKNDSLLLQVALSFHCPRSLVLLAFLSPGGRQVLAGKWSRRFWPPRKGHSLS